MANIYLVGFMGVGKTAIGQLLAKRISREFVDLEALWTITLDGSEPPPDVAKRIQTGASGMVCGT
jgi:shikimate kinase